MSRNPRYVLCIEEWRKTFYRLLPLVLRDPNRALVDNQSSKESAVSDWQTTKTSLRLCWPLKSQKEGRDRRFETSHLAGSNSAIFAGNKKNKATYCTRVIGRIIGSVNTETPIEQRSSEQASETYPRFFNKQFVKKQRELAVLSRDNINTTRISKLPWSHSNHLNCCVFCSPIRPAKE